MKKHPYRIAVVAFLCLISANASLADTLGNTTTAGASGIGWGQTYQIGSWWTADTDLVGDTVYLSIGTVFAGDVAVAVYLTGSGGTTPFTLLAYSVSQAQAVGWMTFTLNTSVNVVAGQTYYLSMIASSSVYQANMFYNTQPQTGDLYYSNYTTANFPVFPASNSPNFNTNGALCIYFYGLPPTPTPTITPISTLTNTPTHSPTITKTYTITPTITLTSTLTSSPTPTHTPTSTISATYTVSPTNTPTRTVTPTSTITPTYTITSTLTVTPTITLTVTATSTLTPSPTTTKIPYTISRERILAYPSPAKGDSVWFYYHAQGASRADIRIYNLIGEHCKTLVHNADASEYIRRAWDLGNVAPGIYFYRATVHDELGTRDFGTRKLVVVK
jgi:hypothetical protein